MSDDWQPGDLALCVRGAPEFVGLLTGQRIPGPRAGAIYTVNDTRTFGELANALGLMLAGFEYWLDASNFRKIRPHQADEEDRETIKLLTGKPAKIKEWSDVG